MREWKLTVPLFLFAVYSIFCLVRPPTISDSLIILSLAAVYSVSLWILSTKIIINKPNDAEIEKLAREVEITRLQKELTALSIETGKLAGQQKGLPQDLKRPYQF